MEPEVQDLARQHAKAAIQVLVDTMHNPKASPSVRASAAKTLLMLAAGKQAAEKARSAPVTPRETRPGAETPTGHSSLPHPGNRQARRAAAAMQRSAGRRVALNQPSPSGRP